MKIFGWVAALLAVVVSPIGVQPAFAVPEVTLATNPLSIDIDPGRITVSGISSGGFMAHQLHVIHSCHIRGAGIMAGGPYDCSNNNGVYGMTACTGFMGLLPGAVGTPDIPEFKTFIDGWYDKTYTGPRDAAGVEEMASRTWASTQRIYAEEHGIDNPENLRGSRVYIFHGQKDKLLPEGVSDALFEYYKKSGVDARSIRYDKGIPAAHAVVTDNWIGWDKAQKCDTFDLAGNFINACTTRSCTDVCPKNAPSCSVALGQCKTAVSSGADVAGNILRHLYTPGANSTDDRAGPKRTNRPEREKWLKERVFSYKQVEGLDGNEDLLRRASMNDAGFLFVPKQCRKPGAGCGLHIAFHGCKMNTNTYGTILVGGVPAFVENAGYNEWAEKNGVVVLYPVVKSTNLAEADMRNPQACWDFWGYSNEPADRATYRTRDGLQTRAVWTVVERLVGKDRLDAVSSRCAK
ncbi:MAG: hypothetical protein H7840_06640 [Alphaproteobacteria bacterium]